ncbi:MAG TPA: ABC transporter ATP-binding protein [Acidimicrobiia bacterium]|nr:ABC transporter ATP-binding protein [Acidimicrobiia bacterium]
MSALLEARGLDVAYGKVTVLEDVDFSVTAGEVVALLGTNGAGKSTLLKAVSGILQPRRGTLLLDGDDMTRFRPAQIVARGVVQMPGGRATFPGLTVRENLVIGGVTVERADRDGRVDEVFEQFPWLAERHGQLAGTLSGGQQQMLALARALMARPRLLMIDELSLGLAPTIVSELLSVVAALRERGVAVVIVDQHVNLALELSDRAYFLERGRVRFEGPASDLRGRTDLLRAVFFAGATA